MVERFSPILANCLTVFRACIEHQESRWGCVGGEHLEHLPLIVMGEKEKAIPPKNPIKLAMQRNGLHRRHNPLLIRQTLATERDERWGGINASYTKSMLGEMVSDRHS